MRHSIRSFCILLFLASAASAQEIPRQYDLRKVDGVTPIKSQSGGTCWAHATMAALESNLLVSGSWKKIGAGDIPALSEYHLDWWNGFNQYKNTDRTSAADEKTGLHVHQGGDYRVSAAYISRGDGVVAVHLANKKNIVLPVTGIAADPHWYKNAPSQFHPTFKKYYARDIEWFTIGDNLENIDAIKRRIMAEGAMGTAYAVNKDLISKDFVHFQPKSHPSKPNHAVAIAGWDDDKVSADPKLSFLKPGCWLIKNSWGTVREVDDKKGGKKTVHMGENGYYWISYYDKVSCRDPEMGAVSFRNVEPMRYSHVYFHDYHGWRDTMKDVSQAFNVFTAVSDHQLAAVSFYTAADNVRYTANIYSSFKDGQLTGLKATRTGTMAVKGFHTVELEKPIAVAKGEKFIVCLEVSAGGQAIDRTSEIEVLLQPKEKKKKKDDGPKGPNGGPIVISKANPGESFYFDGKEWRDLYDHRFQNPDWATFDRTANFCMKALD
jgi:C1A family cysteine protease